MYQFEPADDPLLDHAALEVDGDGAIHPLGSRETLGRLDDVMTGRVFAANGPWVSVRDGALRAVMPNMLEHRRAEASYYRDLLGELAGAAGVALDIADNPHRWEGMADIAAVGDRVVLTYAVPGNVRVTVSLFDLTGKAVKNLSDQQTAVGIYNETFSVADLPTGMYFAVAEIGDKRHTQRIVVR